MDILTAEELAIRLRMSKQTMYRLLVKGLVPGAIKFGGLRGSWRIDGDKVTAWIDEQEGNYFKLVREGVAKPK